MQDDSQTTLLRSIPSVDRVLADPLLGSLRCRYSEEIIKSGVRKTLDLLREQIRLGGVNQQDCAMESVVDRIARYLEQQIGPRLKTVINATGVIIHTNLGRSPLSERVIERFVYSQSLCEQPR